MGYAIAQEIANRGGEVILISGPVSIHVNHPNISLFEVTSALEMYEQAVRHFTGADAAIMAAAVADYRPSVKHNEKMKRNSEKMSIELMPNPDIAAELGKMKNKKQIVAGFALETNNENENASKKLQKKNLDFIVLNSLNDQGAGFQGDTNKVSIIGVDNKTKHFELKTKQQVAVDIVDYLISVKRSKQP
jgi:phosphopantothenoylcysteine decarboxylase/phosphopantothenate--cysteine ligase